MRICQQYSVIAAFAMLAAAAGAATADEKAAQSARDVSAKSAAEPRASSPEEIQSLIRDLASPQYTTRRAAANELHRIGADAFDALYAATDHADPEVAASARYLLRQIKVRWVQNDDSAAVRRIMRSYGDRGDETRLGLVGDLSRLDNREGLAALCRVVRYDRSPFVARAAALAVIRPDMAELRRTPVDHDVIDRELGESPRATVKWVRQYQAQLRDPAASVAAWQKIIEEEAGRLSRNSDETKAEIVVGLLWNLADIFRQSNDRAALLQTVDRMVRLPTNDPERVAGELLRWLVEEKSWDAVDDLLANHQARFDKSKRTLYWAAHARMEQGKTELAEQLAERALRLNPGSLMESFWAAKELEYRDRFDWAVREYHRAIDNQPIATHESILARISLANMLHDHAADKLAADALEPLVKALNTDANLPALYAEVARTMLRNFESNLPDRNSLAAQFHFYRAGQYAAEKDWQRQRESLQSAIRFDSTDADILIAMYRVPESDEKWATDARKRIAGLAGEFQEAIDAAPNESHAYNQWAWLISNTEGDYGKAIEYSKKSLELNTMGESAEASFLDTLGRCYYAVGDYENAVKNQRQAVQRVKHLHVMRRQLELFEKSLAEKNANGNSGR